MCHFLYGCVRTVAEQKNSCAFLSPLSSEKKIKAETRMAIWRLQVVIVENRVSLVS